MNAVAVNAVDTGFSGTGNANCTVAEPPSVTLSLDSDTYSPRSTVSVTAKVMSGGNPAANASVTFTLTKPGSAAVVGARKENPNGKGGGGGGKDGGGGGKGKTVVTDSTGTAVWNYKLGPKDPSGCCYSVSAEAAYSGFTGTSNTVTFTVQ